MLRYRNSTVQAKTYPGANINSDRNHQVVKMTMKLRKKHSSLYQEQLDMNMLTQDKFKTKYAVEVKNQCEMLQTG